MGRTYELPSDRVLKLNIKGDAIQDPAGEASASAAARLLKEIASETQFIVITHAKRTMEAAEALYGVTMQAGLSKLVSVKFDGAQTAGPVEVVAVAAV